jgi:predicted polyphosphate/ATP-dependent NAD kinase
MSHSDLPSKVVGFIVNPIAGMGGAVGLKGTDGEDILRKAFDLGAKPIAPSRACLFLQVLEPFKSHVTLLVGPGMMGEDEAVRYGFRSRTIGVKKDVTTPQDTKSIAGAIVGKGVDILVFCGGDGTARDILDAEDSK